jgi:hypothetical protein
MRGCGLMIDFRGLRLMSHISLLHGCMEKAYEVCPAI